MKIWSTVCTSTIQRTIITFITLKNVYWFKPGACHNPYLPGQQEFQIFSFCGKPNVPHSQNLIMFLSKEIKKSSTSLVKTCFILFLTYYSIFGN